MPTILVVDDVEALAEQYAYDLRRIGSFDTIVATSGASALETVASAAVDGVILDLEMPVMDGFEVLRRLSESHPDLPVVVYTGTGDFDRCVQAVRLGAFSFVDKAESMAKVVTDVERALQSSRLERENRALKKRLADETPLIGESAPMREMRQSIERIAKIPSAVLIQGESGSGKELVAREIHRLGKGPMEAPFVPVNCAALPDQLVESELFGHEKGAFTGADRLHRGAFERADGGTLFLDEIGELPLPVQAKLLRVLEDGGVTRVGGESAIGTGARVVAATNRDLEAAADSGAFRSDLYHRLAVHVVFVPPLRNRRGDIPDLAAHFVDVICERFGMKPKVVPREVLEALSERDWQKNNVRELRNVIERLIIAADGIELSLRDVPESTRTKPSTEDSGTDGTFSEQKARAERRIVLNALEESGWKIGKAAERLGLADHASLLKIMRRHGLSRKD